MRVTSDWHVHTRNSHCGSPEAEMTRMIERARELGLEKIGITDHLNNPQGQWEAEGSRKEFDECERPAGVIFAVEVTTQREYDLHQCEEAQKRGETYAGWQDGPREKPIVWLPEELIERLQPAYILASAHWRLGAPLERSAVIDSYHEQNMALAEHPRVDVIGHPWWFASGGGWRSKDEGFTGKPWFDDFGVIPKSMHDEFAAAAREHGKAVEINANAVMFRALHPPGFREQYREFVAFLLERGVTLSLGSDAHHPDKIETILRLEEDLDILGVTEDNLWQGPG